MVAVEVHNSRQYVSARCLIGHVFESPIFECNEDINILPVERILPRFRNYV